MDAQYITACLNLIEVLKREVDRTQVMEPPSAATLLKARHLFTEEWMAARQRWTAKHDGHAPQAEPGDVPPIDWLG